MKESDIEKHLHNEIEKLGGITRKWVSPGHTGVPDRICFLFNSIFFVEVKTIGGELSLRQSREIEQLRKHNANVYIVHSFYEVNFLLDHLKYIKKVKS